ncbi:MAG: TetR family transcriptional regulator [Sphingomonadales bacterium]
MPTRRTDIEKRIVNAALSLVAVQGWNATTLGEIATAAEVTLVQLHRYFPTRTSIVLAYIESVDSEMLGGGAEGEEARERLFDVLMRRLDVLGRHKNAVKAVLRDLPFDPITGAAVLCHLRRSLAWMLEAAGIGSSGMRGDVRIKGLCLIYLAILRVWLNDESEDLSRTMAALDRQLKRAETIVRCLPARGQPARGQANGPAEHATQTEASA